MTSEWLSPGRFGQATLLSPKALRLYAERGLLVPARVDPANGYRWYAPGQVGRGWLIGLLRSADLSLEAIAAVLDADDPVAELDRRAADRQRRTEVSRGVLERARHHLGQETAMGEITTTTRADQPVLSVLRRLHAPGMDAVVHEELAALRRHAAAAGVAEAGPAFGIFHGPVTDDADGPLEIVLPTADLVDGAGAVRGYRLTGGAVARREAVAPETDFPAILALYDELHSWVTATGRTPVGPPREIWHNSPSDPEPLHLTIEWPYA